jgi:hypothetical protein
MKAAIRTLWSLEIEDDFAAFKPADAECFGTWIRVAAGPRDGAGSESFDIFVCTPRWLEREAEEGGGAVWARHSLILKRFDRAAIASEISKAVEQCSASDWGSLAKKLSRIGAWEFEDYEPKA